MDEFLFYYEPCQIAASLGFWTFRNRDLETRIVQGLPLSNRSWKDRYVFVCGGNWERLPREEVSGDFTKVRRSWGLPHHLVCVFPFIRFFYLLSICDSSFLLFLAVLDRPLLSSMWKERISRILDIEDCHCSIFLEPDLLTSFSFSFGPEPNTVVKALLRANKKNE